MRDFQGKTAVVTGAGSGIGRAMSLAFAREGARVVVADIDAARALAVEDDIVSAGGTASAVQTDVSNEGDLQALRAAALERFGRIDILVNNVGVIYSGAFGDLTMEHWRRAFDVNFFSAVRALQLMLPDIEKQGGGHIVNVASTAALYPYNADRTPYNASKSALVSLSQALAMDLKDRNIGVTCLCPGPTRTNIIEQITFVTPNQPVTPPDLPFKEPEELADMVVHAIRNGVFFLPSNNEVRAIYAEWGADPDRFLDKATARLAEVRAAQAQRP